MNNKIVSEPVKRYPQPDITGKGLPYTYVYPLHQQDLEKILTSLPDSVEEVWVFGSVITLKARQESDLDLCIIGNLTKEDKYKLYSIKTRMKVDFIFYTWDEFYLNKTKDIQLKIDITEKGMKVYNKLFENGVIKNEFLLTRNFKNRFTLC